MVRWGLIGCGDIARKRIAPALRDSPLTELVAVARARANLAEEFAKQFGATRWYREWPELLLDRRIDSVYIATPVHLHAEQTIAAAEAGKHVLCEKPMALDATQCDRMIAACHANHVKLGIAYYRHFYPVVRRVRELLDSGEIGTPVVAQMNAFEWFNPEPSHPRSWLLSKERSGGGPMFDFGCHRVEVLLDLFGPIARVSALTSRVVFEREVEDTAVAVFEFERGMNATLTVSHAVAEAQDTFSIFGSKGSVHIGVLNVGELRVRTAAGERLESHPPAANLHRPLIDDFARAVLDNSEPAVTGHIGRMVAVVEAQIFERGEE
jgi:predicted dehydrogenase